MLCINANEVCILDMNYGIDDYVCLDSQHIYILRKKKEIEYILCINLTKKEKNRGYDPFTRGGDPQRPNNGYDLSVPKCTLAREGDPQA